MRRSFLLSTIVGAIAVPLAAQDVGYVSGTLRSDSGSPLDGALVYVEGHSTTAVADTSGRFELPLPPGLHRLFLYHADLAAEEAPAFLVTVQSGATTPLEYPPAENDAGDGTIAAPYLLDELVAEVDRSSTVSAASPSERRRGTVISEEEIEDLAHSARDIGDLVRRFPGLRVSRLRGVVCITTRRRTTNAPSPHVEARDTCPRMIPVVVDGTLIFEAEKYLAALSPQSIRSVEYLTGAVAGARWGTGSQHGVLVVMTRNY